MHRGQMLMAADADDARFACEILSFFVRGTGEQSQI
jgi:hypothetical protein